MDIPKNTFVIYRAHTIIGYVYTMKQANDICRKYPILTWKFFREIPSIYEQDLISLLDSMQLL